MYCKKYLWLNYAKFCIKISIDLYPYYRRYIKKKDKIERVVDMKGKFVWLYVIDNDIETIKTNFKNYLTHNFSIVEFTKN